MPTQILLTGATGSLGPALAAELARRGAAQKIAVLMRCPPNELRDRFQKWREAVGELLPKKEHAALESLFPVGGDICTDNLGISAAADLRRETTQVIHAAADTNFTAPAERQWDVNVEGTRRTLAFSAACPNLQRFLLVSSVFVSGSRTGPINETAVIRPPDFVTHYQRTKWEAEQVALASGLPVGIARISMVLGSHANGSVHRPGAVHSLIKWFARGFIPMVPGNREATGDVIATETAAQCLAHAAMASWSNLERKSPDLQSPPSMERESPDSPSRAEMTVGAGADGQSGDLRSQGPPIWHIAAAQQAPRMTELIDFVYQHFRARPAWRKKNIPRPEMVAQETFDRFIDSVAGRGSRGSEVLTQSLRSINRFLPDLCFPKTYQTTQAEALWGGPLPHYDWRETMERVIRFCCPP